MEEDNREARSDRILKGGIALFCVALLIAIIWSVRLSTMGLSFSSVVYGSPRIWPGHSVSFRAGALDPMSMRMVDNVQATMHLGAPSPTQPTPQTTWHAAGKEYAAFNEVAPESLGDALSGPLQATVNIRCEFGEDTVKVPIDAVGPPVALPTPLYHWLPLRETLANDSQGRKPDLDPTLRIYPAGGYGVRGLQNTLYAVQLGADGMPQGGHLKAPGNNSPRENAMGLWSISYRPHLKPMALPFGLGATEPSTHDIPLDFPARQMLLSVHRGELDALPKASAPDASQALPPWALLRPGQTVTIRLHTLPIRRPLFIDIWLGDVLLSSSRDSAPGGLRELVVDLPKVGEGLLRIEGYRNAFGPGNNMARMHFWMSAKPREVALADLHAALMTLAGADTMPSLGWAKNTTDPEHKEVWLALALSRLEKKIPGMPQMRSNLKERQASVAAAISAQRRKAHTLLAMTLVLGFASLIAWGFRHHLQTRRQVRDVLGDDLLDGSAEPLDDIFGQVQGADLVGLFDFAMAFLALLLSAYGIWQLLMLMSWNLLE